MKFAVIGAGGVGGYFGGKLANRGEDVWFLARGKHLEVMRANGLTVNSPDGNWVVPSGKMTDNPPDIGPVDVVLFCVKSYGTESAAQQLSPLLTESTIIICLQNGVDNEEKIQRTITLGTVYGGVAYIYSTITAPGVVTHTPGPTKIVFGEMAKGNEATSKRAQQILETMTKAGINVLLSDTIHTELWKKYVFISAVGGMTALTRLTLGEILAVQATKEMLADAMRETEAVGKAKGISLPPNFTEQVFVLLNSYDNNSRSSMYHDLAHYRPMELEAFAGTVIRYGKQFNIPTPVHRAMYAALLPYHLKHKATQ